MCLIQVFQEIKISRYSQGGLKTSCIKCDLALKCLNAFIIHTHFPGLGCEWEDSAEEPSLDRRMYPTLPVSRSRVHHHRTEGVSLFRTSGQVWGITTKRGHSFLFKGHAFTAFVEAPCEVFLAWLKSRNLFKRRTLTVNRASQRRWRNLVSITVSTFVLLV